MAGQSRITYTGAAQSLHGAKVEREGGREEKKIEEKERQHTVRPDEVDSHDPYSQPFI